MELSELVNHVTEGLNRHLVTSQTPDNASDLITELYVRDYITQTSIIDDGRPVRADNFHSCFKDYSLMDYAMDKGFGFNEFESFVQRVYELLIYAGGVDEVIFWKHISQVEIDPRLKINDIVELYNGNGEGKLLNKLHATLKTTTEDVGDEMKPPESLNSNYQNVLIRLISKYIMCADTPFDITSDE